LAQVQEKEKNYDERKEYQRSGRPRGSPNDQGPDRGKNELRNCWEKDIHARRGKRLGAYYRTSRRRGEVPLRLLPKTGSRIHAPSG
jgi:hypothetical protein